MKCWRTCHTAFCCSVQPACRLSLQEIENEEEACYRLFVLQHSTVVCGVSANHATVESKAWSAKLIVCLTAFCSSVWCFCWQRSWGKWKMVLKHAWFCLFVLNCSTLSHDLETVGHTTTGSINMWLVCLSAVCGQLCFYRKWRVKSTYVACLSFSSVWPTMPLQEVKSEVYICGLFVFQQCVANYASTGSEEWSIHMWLVCLSAVCGQLCLYRKCGLFVFQQCVANHASTGSGKWGTNMWLVCLAAFCSSACVATMPQQEVESEVGMCGVFVLQHSVAVCGVPADHASTGSREWSINMWLVCLAAFCGSVWRACRPCLYKKWKVKQSWRSRQAGLYLTVCWQSFELCSTFLMIVVRIGCKLLFIF